MFLHIHALFANILGFFRNNLTDLSRILGLFISAAIFTGSERFRKILNIETTLFLPQQHILHPGMCFLL